MAALDNRSAALAVLNDSDPVVRAIATAALRAVEERRFKRGRATPKADRVRKLRPILELLRARNATFPEMLEICRSEGLDVTPETVRAVLGWRRKDQS